MGVTCTNSIFYPPHLHDPRIPLLSFFILSSIKISPFPGFLRSLLFRLAEVLRNLQQFSQMKQHELKTVSIPQSRGTGVSDTVIRGTVIRGTVIRGTGVSPVREKTFCSQHRRDACATRNFC